MSYMSKGVQRSPRKEGEKGPHCQTCLASRLPGRWKVLDKMLLN